MLMYLREPDVRQLLSRLVDTFPGSEIALDSISRGVVRHQKHHDSMKHMMDAPFQWGIDDIHGIEAWDSRLRVDEVSSLSDIPRRFPAQVPRRYRMIGDLVRTTMPWFAASYRLSRVQLGGEQP
jgi:O-methyltransferase involved in polyketide biosynthesis